MKNSSRLDFFIDDQRSAHCRLTVASQQMQSQGIGRGADYVQRFVETDGAFQGRLQIGFVKSESSGCGGAALGLSELLDRSLQIFLYNFRIERRGPVVAFPGF